MPARPRVNSALVINWLILLITLIATVQSGLWVRDILIERDQQQQQFAAAQLTEKIHERLHAYALVLRAGAGLFAGTNRVTRDDWRHFVNTLSIAESVRGVQGFGFSLLLDAESLDEHVERMRSEGLSNYQISPPVGDRPVLTSIVFLEPLDELNQRAIGYDMFSEPVRRAAMKQARDTGRAALTGKVTLVQETGVDPQPGSLMYVPIYRNGAPVDSLEQRREALVGWVYSPYRMTDLMQGILGDWSVAEGTRRPIGLRIFDTEREPDKLLFSNLPAQTQGSRELRYPLDFNGHRWVLEFAPSDTSKTPSFVAAWSVVAGVLLLGLMIFALHLNLHRTQRKAERIARRLTRNLEEALVESSRFRDALDRMDTYVFMKNRDLRYTYANQATLDRLAITREDLIDTHGEQVFDQISRDRISQLDTRVLAGERVTEEVELNVRGKRGMFLQIKTPMYENEVSDKIVGLIGISTDITKAKQHAQEIERLAHYDALTGLPNRSLFGDRLSQAMAMVDRRKSSLAVVYLDLDGFKEVNDSYGHSTGDQVLINVARRMRKVLRKEDTLSRLGGDEFVAVLIDIAPDANYQHHLQRLLSAASRPVVLGDKVIRIGASLGVTFYPQSDIDQGDQLLRQADQAMYQAKLAGKGRFHLFDTEQDRSTRTQHETVERVREALQNGELCLYYQPKVNMRTGEILGAEALLRWQHPERGLLAPGAFISLVESTTLMLDIGQWVMNSALKQMDEWLQAGVRMPLSINISAVELSSANFLQTLESRLQAWPNIAPTMLELEVLETAALGELDEISRLLEDCRKLGVGIAIDDFGTGYSSLTYFKQLPARVVKIDQSFVRGILRDPADLAILDGIVRLADALDRQLIAEGVETHEHAEMLLRIGCDLAQGYGIARPMPAQDLLPWARQWHAPEHWATLGKLPGNVQGQRGAGNS